jgi:hypothetical protein
MNRRTFLTQMGVGLVAVAGGGDVVRILLTRDHKPSHPSGASRDGSIPYSNGQQNGIANVPWNISPTEPGYTTLSQLYALEPQNLSRAEATARQAVLAKMKADVAIRPPVVNPGDQTHADYSPTQAWFDSNGELVLSWLCCYSVNPSQSSVFKSVVQQHPHAVFMLGDNGYSDGNIRLNPGVRPPVYFTPRTQVEADLLQAYVTKSFLQIARGTNFSNLKAKTMIYAVQDDHDYMADGQELFTVDPTTHDVVLAMHSPSLEPARRAFGRVFTQVGQYPTPTYFSTDVGGGVQVTSLNGREYAYDHKYDAAYKNGSFPAFLGPNQWAWFKDVVGKASNNRHIVVLPVSPTFSRGPAGGNQISQASRDLFVKFLNSYTNKKFAVLTGDRHAAGIAQFGNVTELLAAPSGVNMFHDVNLSDAPVADRLWSNGTNTGDPSSQTLAFGVIRLTSAGRLTAEFRRSIDGSTIATPYNNQYGKIRIW